MRVVGPWSSQDATKDVFARDKISPVSVGPNGCSAFLY